MFTRTGTTADSRISEERLYKQKRPLPKVLSEAETHVESWRSSLLETVHERIDVATYMLVASACGIIGYSAQILMPRQASRVEMQTRDLLFGLQFALSGLKGELPAVDQVPQCPVAHAKNAARFFRCDPLMNRHWLGYRLNRLTRSCRIQKIHIPIGG